MNDRILSFLGLCKKAGKMQTGKDVTIQCIKEHKAKLVLVARDFSHHSEKDIKKVAENFDITVIKLPYNKDELEFVLSKLCGVICITDEGFAKRTEELILEKQAENTWLLQ